MARRPVPRPDYSNAGANRDRPRMLPSEGPALRLALDKAGVATDAEVAAVETAAADAQADADQAMADAAVVSADLATHEGAADPHPQYVESGEPQPDVRGLRETSGPTFLDIGDVADGQVLQRSGTEIVGATIAGAGELSYAPGSISLAAGQFRVMTKELQLTGAQRLTMEGTARLRIT